MITPEQTPEANTRVDAVNAVDAGQPPPPIPAPVRTRGHHRGSLTEGLDQSNIVESRTRGKSGQSARLLAQLITLQSTVATAMTYRLHRDYLPPEPANWKAMNQHKYRKGFYQAAQKEIDTLNDKCTWEQVPRKDINTRPLPLTWVFKYKFDSSGLLFIFGARICVRGDLQIFSQQVGVAADTLTSTALRIVMAIAAYFDLELHYLDAVNAFVNSPLRQLVQQSNCQIKYLPTSQIPVDGLTKPYTKQQLEKLYTAVGLSDRWVSISEAGS